MVQRRIDSFFCQQTSSVRGECFFSLRGKHIIETPMFFNDWYTFNSLTQNHSAITQLFHLMTSSSLKPTFYICSEMLWELLLHWAEKKSKKCLHFAWGTLCSPGQPPYPPTSSYTTDTNYRFCTERNYTLCNHRYNTCELECYSMLRLYSNLTLLFCYCFCPMFNPCIRWAVSA